MRRYSNRFHPTYTTFSVSGSVVEECVYIYRPKFVDKKHLYSGPHVTWPKNVMAILHNPFCTYIFRIACIQYNNNNNNNKLLLLLLLTAIGLSPGGSGYSTCIQNMKLVTNKFKSGGLHEKHVVATWSVGNHLSICL